MSGTWAVSLCRTSGKESSHSDGSGWKLQSGTIRPHTSCTPPHNLPWSWFHGPSRWNRFCHTLAVTLCLFFCSSRNTLCVPWCLRPVALDLPPVRHSRTRGWARATTKEVPVSWIVFGAVAVESQSNDRRARALPSTHTHTAVMWYFFFVITKQHKNVQMQIIIIKKKYQSRCSNNFLLFKQLVL